MMLAGERADCSNQWRYARGPVSDQLEGPTKIRPDEASVVEERGGI